MMLERIVEFISTSLPNFMNARILDNGNDVSTILIAEGEASICDKVVTIRLKLNEYFPLVKPTYYLVPPNALGYIPHISASGDICYINNEGVCFDGDNPEGIIRESYLMAITTLEDGITGKNAVDSMNEVVAYFGHNKGSEEYDSNIKLTDDVKLVKLCEIKTLNQFFLGDSAEKITEYCNKYYQLRVIERATYSDAIYIPLRKNTVLPFQWFDSFWNIEQIKKIISENISTRNKRFLEKLLKAKVSSKKAILIILMVQLPNGNKVLLGISFKPVDGEKRTDSVCHPLLKKEGEYTLLPVVISRHDPEYLAPRGGANRTLRNSKVALIGCGSVGGFIAWELARAGIQYISLFDKDLLEETNIYRHSLGIRDKLLCTEDTNGKWSSINIPKIFGLKRNIEDNLPYTVVDVKNHYFNSIERIIKKNEVNFRGYDLIIVAIGNPTVELYLNSYFHSEASFPPAIFTWLEAYGIGGHAIVTNNRKSTGCLKCLYTDPEDEKSAIYNRASFADRNQNFSKDMAGCANMFTPFGSLDAMQTAVLATRLAVDVLIGKEIDNPALSWKGDSESFIAAGYKLSPRYNLTTQMLYENRYSYKITNCPICNKQRSS